MRKKINIDFLYYLYLVLKAVNHTEAFRYRMEGDNLFLYDMIDASSTIDRENGTFGFSYIPYEEELDLFLKKATKEVARVREESRLISNEFGENIIHFSAVPWIRFTSLSHPRKFGTGESIPKITFGQFFETLQGLFREQNG